MRSTLPQAVAEVHEKISPAELEQAIQSGKAPVLTHVRVVNLPANLHTDWVSKDYPSEGTGASN